MTKPLIKIIVVDDHKIFTDGLCILLSNEPDFEVIGKATNGKEALHILNRLQPDILIMDLNMPVFDGQVTAEKIRALYPKVKILILSMYNTLALNQTLKTLGVNGYLPKDSDSNLVFSVIRSILNGDNYFRDNERTNEYNEFSSTDIFLKKHNLTNRELEILKLIANNYSSQQIANELCISLFTVDTHRKNMIQKLKVDKKTGLINFAIKHQVTKQN